MVFRSSICGNDCALFPSELFGYKQGAFTDAEKDKAGYLALAEGGALFLDDIEAMSLAMQVHLLRVLQEHTYEPLVMRISYEEGHHELQRLLRDLPPVRRMSVSALRVKQSSAETSAVPRLQA